MNDLTLLKDLGFILVAAAGFSLLGRLLRAPSIVAYLIAGLFLGPLTGWVTLSGELEVISESGIVLLLFLVGLELHLEKLRDVGRAVVLAGLGQIGLTALIAWFLARALDYPVASAWILAAALAFSSTVIAVKLLDEQKALNHRFARIAVGILMIQDLAVILILTFVAGFEPGESPALTTMAVGMLKALAGVAFLLLAVIAASRYVLPWMLAWAGRHQETLYTWSLCWCFLCVLGAHALGLSEEIGAFLGGISLGQTPYSHDLRHRVRPLMNFFIAVFFVSLGIQMDVAEGMRNWQAATVFIAFALIGKFFITSGLLLFFKQDRETAIDASLTLSQISEFSFILGALAVDRGIVPSSLLAVLTLVGLGTMSASSLLIQFRAQVRPLIEKVFLRGFQTSTTTAPTCQELENHVIVVGMNSLGRMITRELLKRGEVVVALDTDLKKFEGLGGTIRVLGNAEYLTVLEEAGFSRCKLLISALQTESANELLAFRCKKQGIPCSIHVNDLNTVDNLLAMDAAYLMIPKVDGVKLQQETLKEEGWLPA